MVLAQAVSQFQTSFGSEQATGSATCVHSEEACWGCVSSGLREYIQSFPLLNTVFTHRKQTKYFPAVIPQHVTIKLVISLDFIILECWVFLNCYLSR